MSLDDIGGWPAILRTLTQHRELPIDHAERAMTEILHGEATPAQIAGLLIALKTKGETAAEMTGLVRAMIAAATPLDLGDRRSVAIDIVGTGGAAVSQRHALNVSTMASFVAAAAGAVVCKHGNRKVSSTSGAFDFLELLGIPADMTPETVARTVRDIGLGFAFARTFHPAMRFAAPVRAELGIPTAFNLLGPLANPGRVTRGLIGVSDTGVGAKMAQVLASLGAKAAWVVTGHGALDEIALTGPTIVQTVRDGAVGETFEVSPADFGLAAAEESALVGGDAARNVAIFDAIVAGEPSAFRDIVIANAAAALVVADVSPDLRQGAARAAAAIDCGAVRDVVSGLRAAVSPSG